MDGRLKVRAEVPVPFPRVALFSRAAPSARLWHDRPGRLVVIRCHPPDSKAKPPAGPGPSAASSGETVSRQAGRQGSSARCSRRFDRLSSCLTRQRPGSLAHMGRSGQEQSQIPSDDNIVSQNIGVMKCSEER